MLQAPGKGSCGAGGAESAGGCECGETWGWGSALLVFWRSSPVGMNKLRMVFAKLLAGEHIGLQFGLLDTVQ